MKTLDLETVQMLLPVRDSQVHKYLLGHSLLIGGNAQMAGAVLLAGRACTRVGCGITRILTAPDNTSTCHLYIPEAMVGSWEDSAIFDQWLKDADQLLIGPGLGREKESFQLFNQVLSQSRQDQPLVIDGDGLILWTQLRDKPSRPNVIMTPHQREWQELQKASHLDDPQAFADFYQVILLLKGPQSRLFIPYQEGYLNLVGNPGMAIGGMGDCLAGMILGLIGQVRELKDAVIIASFLHTWIANRLYLQHYCVQPSELVEMIPRVMRQIWPIEKVGFTDGI